MTTQPLCLLLIAHVMGRIYAQDKQNLKKIQGAHPWLFTYAAQKHIFDVRGIRMYNHIERMRGAREG